MKELQLSERKRISKESSLLLENGCEEREDLLSNLIAAKLNVLIGNESSCIADVIDDADDCMSR